MAGAILSKDERRASSKPAAARRCSKLGAPDAKAASTGSLLPEKPAVLKAAGNEEGHLQLQVLLK